MTPSMHASKQSSPTVSSLTAPTPRRIASRLRTRGRAALLPAGALLLALGCVAPATASPNPSTTVITRYAGIAGAQGSPTPGPATSSDLSYPQSVTVDPSGNLYIVDPGVNQIEKVTPSGTLSIVAGNGQQGLPTPGPATSSKLNNPQQVALDSSGDLYIADDNNHEVEKVTPSGTLSVIAGTGTSGTPTPGPATNSKLNNPTGVAVDSNGNVYICEGGNDEIDKVTPAGTLSVVQGGLNSPYNIAIDSSNNLYIADATNQRIAELTAGGVLSNIAGLGGGLLGFPTAGPATSSRLYYPFGVAVDPSGNVYISDTNAYDLLKVTPGGTLSILAGEGMGLPPTYGGAPASSALRSPYGVAVDSSGVVYIADGTNRTVDRIGPTTPAAPTIISATPGQTSIALSFNPPVSDGTSLIDGYEASTDGGTTWQTITTTSGSGNSLQATLSGLTAGSTYSVLVRADNTSGAGSASAQSSVTLSSPSTSTTSTSTSTSSTTSTTSATSTTTATSTTQATSSTATTSAPVPNSQFTELHAPYVNTTTGAIMLYESVQNPGTLTWRALYRNGTLGQVATAAAVCPAFQETLNGQCRPDWILYGQGSSTVTAVGTVSAAITPGPAARTLLRRARREHRAGVPVAIVVTFQSAYGGAPVTHIVTVLATLHAHGASIARLTSKH
jgi:DNA-binding beta-propeller fold protein YncE